MSDIKLPDYWLPGDQVCVQDEYGLYVWRRNEVDWKSAPSTSADDKEITHDNEVSDIVAIHLVERPRPSNVRSIRGGDRG